MGLLPCFHINYVSLPPILFFLSIKMPRFDFLKRVAVSQFTLPVAVVIALPLWLLLPDADASLLSCVVGAVPVGLTVWLIRELNARSILLRINSKMLSSCYAVLMGFAVPLHGVGVANVLALALVLAYMLLFSIYQKPQPVPVFVSFCLAALATIVRPCLVLYIPFCWVALIHLRAFTLRTALASVFGLLMPYWVIVGIMYYLGEYQMIVDGVERFADIAFFDYSGLSLGKILFLAYAMLIMIVGFVEMTMSDYADKVRVKTLYRIVSNHGFIAFAILLLLPHLYDEMAAFIVVDAAIMGGHYVAQNYKQVTHVFFLLALLLGFVLLLFNA